MTGTRPQLNGKHWIGGEASAEAGASFAAVDPATNATLAPNYPEATAGEVDRAFRLAEQSFQAFRSVGRQRRADLLERIADAIEALGDPLLERAESETGLPSGRLVAERTRTVYQTRLFAEVVREGSWVSARIDHGDPTREPNPRPDIRQCLMPIGPVATFGASNFPLAIGVVGTDTVAALGAGCPVVVKSHPAHPGTCELLAQAVLTAIEQADVPRGIFSLLHGAGEQVGLAMVRHPATAAVAFTGSLRGGRALFDAAAARPQPIPVFAEMGSTNPVFLLPGALAERAGEIAAGYVNSVNLGVGQFCTNPGVVLGLGSLDTFLEAAAKAAAATSPATMLHQGIRSSYVEGTRKITALEGIAVLGRSAPEANANKTEAACVIYSTDAQTFQSYKELGKEIFGPTSIVVRCTSKDDLLRIASDLSGQLTATLHGTEQDLIDYRDLVALLETKVGRLIFNGFPTGIEVCHAIHHGGPYPATTAAQFTSIGTASILRFARPICYQDYPDEALPECLQEVNPAKIWRLVDGAWSHPGD